MKGEISRMLEPDEAASLFGMESSHAGLTYLSILEREIKRRTEKVISDPRRDPERLLNDLVYQMGVIYGLKIAATIPVAAKQLIEGGGS